MSSPRSKIPGTPWWCVEDLESVKKAVEKNNRSIELLETSFLGFKKQHQDWCSSVHCRCTSLEATCEQLSGRVQTLLTGAQQQIREEHVARIDQLFAHVHQEHARETGEFNERLEQLDSKLEQSLSLAASTVETTDVVNAAGVLDGTLAMLVNIKGSLEQMHLAVSASCAEAHIKGSVTISTPDTVETGFQSATTFSSSLHPTQMSPVSPKPSPSATPKHSPSATPGHTPVHTPRVQRRASAGDRHMESSCGSNDGTFTCPTRTTDAVTPLRKRPSRPPSRRAFLTQSVRSVRSLEEKIH